MSRIAKLPIIVPNNLKVILDEKKIIIKNDTKKLIHFINKFVNITFSNNILNFNVKKNISIAYAQAGTCRSLVNSMILGLTNGFFKKLQLIGVGYRVIEIKNNIISLSLGYSHVIKYKFPNDINIKISSPTEFIVTGIDKQKVGQVSADLRSYRKPEVYKGKGIRYVNEFVRTKEAKKK